MEKYYEDNRCFEGGYEDNDYEQTQEDYGRSNCGCEEKKRCFEVIEKKCYEPKPKPQPKPRPCRCGGHKFVEPTMKRTNCCPRHCHERPSCCSCCECCRD